MTMRHDGTETLKGVISDSIDAEINISVMLKPGGCPSMHLKAGTYEAGIECLWVDEVKIQMFGGKEKRSTSTLVIPYENLMWVRQHHGVDA